METPDEKWFRERLRHFLEIRHPPRQFHHVMIERRSRLAFESYAPVSYTHLRAHET